MAKQLPADSSGVALGLLDEILRVHPRHAQARQLRGTLRLRMGRATLALVDFDEALAAVRDIGPGGHYLGHPHTVENFQRGFFMPELFDNNSIEQWKAEGSKDTITRALEEARRLLRQYEEPKLDEGKDEAIRDFIARREREIPADGGLNQEF